jgi:predicted transcriptional regulator
MSKSSDKVKLWREKTKIRLVESFGGKCCICGYNKCMESLAFHHIDPSKKEFSFGKIIANPCSWKKIVVEIRKCICVCNNCHGEIHKGITKIPNDAPMFNEKYVDYKKLEIESKMDKCPVCGKLKPQHQITCSRECGSSRSNNINWNDYDLNKMINEMSIIEISEIIGVSPAAVSKRLKKLQKEQKIKNTKSREKFSVTKEELEKLIKEKSMTELGKMYNVSSNAIKKRCVKYGIKIEKYYWQNNKY